MPEQATIKDAADRLGVSADTIRRRLKRGELTGEQIATAQGFTWMITLPDLPEPPASNAPSDHSEAHSASPGALGTEDAIELIQLRERVSGLERLTTELMTQRDELRERAHREEEANREMRILLRQAQSMVQAIPATIDWNEANDRPATPPHRTPETTAARPRSFWNKLLGRL